MTPTLTGRSTVLMLLFGLLLPGTYARSGMKAPNGTFMKRLLSTSQAEQFCACAVADPNTPSPASATVATAPTTLLILYPPSVVVTPTPTTLLLQADSRVERESSLSIGFVLSWPQGISDPQRVFTGRVAHLLRRDQMLILAVARNLHHLHRRVFVQLE